MRKKTLIRWMILLPLAFLQASCANWLIRQECKNINWYQHSYDVAMEGRRLSGDDKIERCRKAEYDLPETQMDLGFKAGMTNYCKPETVYVTGRKGEEFNTELCDPGQANYLKQRHKEGVYIYCAVDNGFSAGASGRKYQNLCPAGMEKAFLKEYNRGRKKWLNAMVEESQKEVRRIDREILDTQRESMTLEHRLNLLNLNRPVTAAPNEDPALAERDRLNTEIRRLSDEVKRKRSRQSQLRQKIKDYKVEMAGLD
ncbi:MAG: DUF2799 domain-containing protein [Bdellovibrionaceae bacterium]|nr:DUF2799 domain-containing protein [Pseudobdellovibrionaceae bacterium]